MTEIAGLVPERADEVACLIEHILTYDEIAAMGAKLNPPAIIKPF